MLEYNTNIIKKDLSLRKTLSLLNRISDTNPKIPLTLFIINEENQLIGTVTDGDIRRRLVTGAKLDEPISSSMNTNFRFIKKNGLKYHDIDYYKKKGIQLLPLINDNKEIIKIYNLSEINSLLPIEAVIMAGGKGTRLKPLTNETPKPLLKIGDKPIMEHNLDRLISFGIEHITVSVCYLGDQIVSYFGNGTSKGVNISYIREEDPLGTAGSLSLIENFKSETVLIINSDVLTTLNFEDFYKDFIAKDADISVVTIPYQVKLPYGIFNLNDNSIKELKEKPEYTYFANAGIYLMKKELIKQSPKNQHLDTTEFIEQQIAKDKKIVSFPFWGYWLDVGKPEDFENAQKAIQILNKY